jgi:hypothetical protein
MEHIDSLPWRTASKSGNGGNCVEVAGAASTVRIRDTKSRERGMLTVDSETWHAFIGHAKAGRLDLGRLERQAVYQLRAGMDHATSAALCLHESGRWPVASGS